MKKSFKKIIPFTRFQLVKDIKEYQYIWHQVESKTGLMLRPTFLKWQYFY